MKITVKTAKNIARAVALALSLVSIPALAGVVFFDDFEDGNTDGWTFHRADATEWGNLDNRLNSSIGSDDFHDGTYGFAIIDGLETPDQFTFEADISVTNYNYSSDRGHVGFVWGVEDPNDASTVFNTTYLRTHSNHVTHWNTHAGGNYTAPEIIYGVGSVVNNVTYHMQIDVDYINQELISTFTNGANTYTNTISGAAFTAISEWSGGSLGVISWGEEVTYDNVKVTVPAPSGLAMLFLAIAGIAARKKFTPARG